MADFELHINDAAFQRRGISPVVDENLYGEFIDEFAPDAPKLDVTIAPHLLWSDGHFARTAHELFAGEVMLPVGFYKANTITIPASKDVERANKLLRHESKHFFDATTGESLDSPIVTKRRITGALAVAGVGLGVGIATGRPKVAGASALSLIPATQLAYWKAPHEIAARKFADDKDVAAKYSNIIKYKNI